MDSQKLLYIVHIHATARTCPYMLHTEINTCDEKKKISQQLRFKLTHTLVGVNPQTWGRTRETLHKGHTVWLHWITLHKGHIVWLHCIMSGNRLEELRGVGCGVGSAGQQGGHMLPAEVCRVCWHGVLSRQVQQTREHHNQPVSQRTKMLGCNG